MSLGASPREMVYAASILDQYAEVGFSGTGQLESAKALRAVAESLRIRAAMESMMPMAEAPGLDDGGGL